MFWGDVKSLPAALSRLGRVVLAVAGICVVATMLTACGDHKSNSHALDSEKYGSGANFIDDSYKLKITNASTGGALTIADSNQENSAALVTATSDDTDVQRWHVMPLGNRTYNVENMLTHQVMGVYWAQTTAGTSIVQYSDNGTDDHIWKFYLLADGNYVIKNYNSNLYLTSDSDGNLTQEERDTSSTLQEWTITVTSDLAYPLPITVSGDGIYVHDPMMLQASDGTYYLYGTHNTLATSTDLATFTSVDDGIFSEDFSWWADDNTVGTDGRTDLWAPDVMYSDGTYYQYYSIPIYEDPSDSTSNEGAEAVIALATSSSPTGSWTDAGTVISSCGTTTGCTTTWNAIDPHPYLDSDGNWWMSFGSWEDGTHALQLDPSSGLRISSDSTLYSLGVRSAGEEGSVIFKHTIDGTVYYYYFASINVCCNGTDSTYRIIVGRSTSPTGPFYDRGDVALTAGGGTILLSSHGNIYGPGGQSVMETDGDPLLVYHYYDGANSGTATLGLNYLKFDSDGWPYVADE